MYFAEPAGEEPIRSGGSLRVALWAATAATIAVGLFAGTFIAATGEAGRALFP